jgi:hypothetical protein
MGQKEICPTSEKNPFKISEILKAGSTTMGRSMAKNRDLTEGQLSQKKRVRRLRKYIRPA